MNLTIDPKGIWYHGSKAAFTATVLPEAGRSVKGARETGVHFIQTYLNGLSKEFHDDMIVLICDGAAWHKAGKLMIPDMITILFIPLYSPEMNLIEQIWKERRAKSFCNEVFASIEKVVDCLYETIKHLAKETIIAITRRDWIGDVFIAE